VGKTLRFITVVDVITAVMDRGTRGPAMAEQPVDYSKNFEVRYYTRDALEEMNPSRKDHVSYEQEQRWKRSAVSLVINASVKLKM
jgi:hypothetical protein